MKKYLKKPQKQLPNSGNSYLKYTGLAFQMIGSILIMAFIGNWLDNKLQNTKPILTLVFSLTAVIVLLYKLISNFTK
jgi:F0F1-type ATP synthase assembly protein I